MRVARAAVLFEEGLALSHITAGKHHREDLVDHFLAIGVRQAIARGDQFFGPLAELLVGEFGEPVSIHEGQVGEPDGARLEALEVEPDLPARVIIDERTGTIVVGEAVTLRPAAITFGSLTVEIDETPEVSQPAPLAKGATTAVPRSRVKVNEANNPMRVVGKAATVGDVAAALAALGAKPRDLVSILQALSAAGALRAELVTQ